MLRKFYLRRASLVAALLCLVALAAGLAEAAVSLDTSQRNNNGAGSWALAPFW